MQIEVVLPGRGVAVRSLTAVSWLLWPRTRAELPPRPGFPGFRPVEPRQSRSQEGLAARSGTTSTLSGLSAQSGLSRLQLRWPAGPRLVVKMKGHATTSRKSSSDPGFAFRTPRSSGT